MSLYFQISLLLLGGLVLGLLPGTLSERKGLRLIADIGAGIAVTLAVAWLIAGWPLPIPVFLEPQPQRSAENTNLDEGPNYEPVVLPLRPLRPLLKPVVYRSAEEICDSVTRAAQKNDLPVHFLIRLLYQESSFRAEAISSAGALGIAQFMPETASDRRLDNPFDPVQAVPASARLLRDLYRKFGNLGLAAAAYNAGPKRIEDWQTNKAKAPLPAETVGYVKAVTGFPVETWSGALSGSPALKIPAGAPCQHTVGLLAWDGPDEIPMPAADPRSKISTDAKAALAMRKKLPGEGRRRLMSTEIAASESTKPAKK